MVHHHASADLLPGAPAFVPTPTFVFGQAALTPSRSELLRRQIAAAQEARRVG